MGTLINCALIVVGGVIGLIFKKAVSEEIEYSIQKAIQLLEAQDWS